MALQKLTSSEDGRISLNYHKIIQCNMNALRRDARVEIASYVDAQDRQDNAGRPVSVRAYDFSDANVVRSTTDENGAPLADGVEGEILSGNPYPFTNTGNCWAEAYEFIKTQPEFTGSVDA